MSIFQVQQCLFDHLRALENAPPGVQPELALDGYEVTDLERAVLQSRDVGALYDMGVHPVIINGYCRSQGYRRADYRVLFSDDQRSVEGKGRWQTS